MSRHDPAPNTEPAADQQHLLYGLQAVRAALRSSDVVVRLWVQRGRRDRRMGEILRLAREREIAVRFVSRAELDRRAPEAAHQGVVAEAGAPPPMDGDGLLEYLAGLDHAPLLLILDGVQDPHNLGACLRTADAAGVDAVVVPRDRAVGLTPTVRKVACGAAERVPLAVVTNLARTLTALADQGIRCVGAAGEATATVFERELTGPLALVLGGEERGLRRLTREACDELIRLPMLGGVESLNVSVAAGVCLYEALRQRGVAAAGGSGG